MRAGGSCRSNSRRRVLEYEAVADANLESPGGQQEALRVRLAAINIFACDQYSRKRQIHRAQADFGQRPRCGRDYSPLAGIESRNESVDSLDRHNTVDITKFRIKYPLGFFCDVGIRSRETPNCLFRSHSVDTGQQLFRIDPLSLCP